MKSLKHWILFFLSLALTIGLILFMEWRVPGVPPLRLLAPFGGLWENAPDQRFARPKVEHVHDDGVRKPIEIQYDRHDIPHVFANSDQDLYFAQGWTTARDRLWQMDFEARAGLGELAQVVGPKALAQDEMFVALGIREAAQKSLEIARQDPKTWQSLKAYADGVNAYIHSLKVGTEPIEFKLIGYKPNLWTPLKSEVIAKLMQYRLSAMNSDLPMTRTLSRLGPAKMWNLFPAYPYDAHPIISKPWKLPIKPTIPSAPKGPFLPPVSALGQANLFGKFPDPDKGLGSNCWALMGSKTKSGYPILANDTHLDYSLPGTWYQIQLHDPNINVYGVSIPGTPGVVIGFNDAVAWGVTDGYDDVADWYYIRFKNKNDDEYRYDHQWMLAQKTSTVIHVRGQKPVIRTIIRTRQGPVVYNPGSLGLPSNQPIGMAFRWIGYQPANDFLTFLNLDRAQSVADCQSAVTNYVAPSQNFTCIDKSGNLGLWHAGKIPVKWPNQWRTISDGSDPRYDWHGWIPFANLPQILNPKAGYVRSANQVVTDSHYPYYLNGDFPDSFRAWQIERLIKSQAKLGMSDMRRMQDDTNSVFAAQGVVALEQ